MALRERILQPLDQIQRIVFALFFGITLLGNIGLELYVSQTYQLHLLHFGLIFGLIQIFFNPKGIRLLFFCFFLFLIMKLFQNRIYSDGYFYPSFHTDHYLLSFLLIFLTTSFKVVLYSHFAVYSLLAYFAFKKPTVPKTKQNKALIDQINEL